MPQIPGAVKLSYASYGDPHLPTLILVMGLATPAVAWPRAFIAELVQQGLHVVTPDNRDSGMSPKIRSGVSRVEVASRIAAYLAGMTVTAPYRLEEMAADIEAVMDAVGVDRAHVAGISLGGMIGQVLAFRAPHRVMSLTCISSASGNPKTGLGHMEAILSILKEPPKGADKDALRAHLRRVMLSIGTPGETYADEELDAIISVTQRGQVTSECGARQLLAMLASGNRSRQLQQLATPTLVIHGTADPLLPVQAGREIARLIPGARLEVFEGMGHDLPKRCQKQIAGLIAEHCYQGALR
ncbi:MAG: alpha/beta hydrolase [Duodenibacillus sp.]|nr:alpha/beta hydrolase [Duodenibacillus sp.]